MYKPHVNRGLNADVLKGLDVQNPVDRQMQRAEKVSYSLWILSCKNKVLFFQNACITTKLRDFLYVVLNHPNQYCRERPRMVLLKRKIQNMYTIITRMCYRVRTRNICPVFHLVFRLECLIHAHMCPFVWQDLVFFTDDCEAIDTGHSSPHYAEDRLQLLVEDRWATRQEDDSTHWCITFIRTHMQNG